MKSADDGVVHLAVQAGSDLALVVLHALACLLLQLLQHRAQDILQHALALVNMSTPYSPSGRQSCMATWTRPGQRGSHGLDILPVQVQRYPL